MDERGLEIENEDAGKAIVLKLTGSVDIDSSPQVRRVLRGLWKGKDAPAVVMNLEAVNHIDTSAIATFIESAQKLSKCGGRLILCGLNELIRGRIALAQLDDYFAVFETQEDALAALDEKTQDEGE